MYDCILTDCHNISIYSALLIRCYIHVRLFITCLMLTLAFHPNAVYLAKFATDSAMDAANEIYNVFFVV
jgi:hypothetical protein